MAFSKFKMTLAASERGRKEDFIASAVSGSNNINNGDDIRVDGSF
jgi:hypothetical protein